MSRLARRPSSTRFLFCVFGVALVSVMVATANAQTFVVDPVEYPGALRNPLKGFRPLTKDALAEEKRFATITHSYFKWNELENDKSDTVERIRDKCDVRWDGVEEKAIKVIPSIYLDFNEDEKYWPADMQTGDYSSSQFKRRLVGLISKLGEAWNDDPRVAWVETSTIGLWGEQHSPSPTPEMQRIMGDAFTRAFPNKKLLVRHPTEFTDYEVGFTWGSWAHGAQIDHPEHGGGIDLVNRRTGRWKTHPMEGETAYNWGTKDETLGGKPNITLTTPKYHEILLDSIRKLHCSGLGWVAKYSRNNERVVAGADLIQKAFGYRFVITKFAASQRSGPGKKLRVAFRVVNTGSAPFFEKWPVEVSLLNPSNKSVVWKTELKDVDIRDWLCGDNWDDARNVYRSPPKTYTVDRTITLPNNIPRGQYVIALAILDPAGNQPALRFAIMNYFPGGRHPMGLVGVETDVRNHQLSKSMFTDPMSEPRLGYESLSADKQSGSMMFAARFDAESKPDDKWQIGTKDGTILNAIPNAGWVCYRDFDFGRSTNHVRISASAGAGRGGQIEMRLDSPTGPKIGTVIVQSTGDFGKFETFQSQVTPVQGRRDLYLVFRDSQRHGEYLFDIKSFKFTQR